MNILWNFFVYFNFTPLIMAFEEGQIEIAHQLLSMPNIDINCKDILKCNFFNEIFFNVYF